MDKELYDYLLNLDLKANEIEDMRAISPMLDHASIKDVTSVVNILNFYNYPKSELAELVYANPNILLSNTKKLASRLSTLASNGVDTEEYLKLNPYFAV